MNFLVQTTGKQLTLRARAEMAKCMPQLFQLIGFFFSIVGDHTQ